ncbi:MAG TPA: ABC transporter permease [Nevskiaceae bacterium]
MSSITAAPARMRAPSWRRVKAFATSTWLILAFAVAWQLLAVKLNVFYFPPLTDIFRHGYEMWFSGSLHTLGLTAGFFEDVLPSLERLFAGLALAVVVGVAAGVVIGLSPVADDMLDPTLQFARSVPPVALIPIFMLLFGIGTQMRIILIFFSSVWPILLNVVAAVRSIEPLFHDTATAFNIRFRDRITRIVLPAAMPLALAGLRVSTALALIVMVLSEMVAATSGIGYRLLFSQQQFNLGDMWACVVLLGIIGYLLNLGVAGLEAWLLRWQEDR